MGRSFASWQEPTCKEDSMPGTNSNQNLATIAKTRKGEIQAKRTSYASNNRLEQVKPDSAF
jgi:hypothetical protein